jgi:MFS family permease
MKILLSGADSNLDGVLLHCLSRSTLTQGKGPAVVRPRPPTRLWQRNFVLLWSGQAISQVGSQVTIWALPLTAVLVLHASPVQTGLLASAGIAPYVLAGLFAGVWVDRVPRRPLMIAADIGRALLILSIPLAAFIRKLTLLQLYGVAAGMAVGAIVFDIASVALLASIISGDRLLDTNSRLEVSNAVANMVGPGLAGILVQLLSGPGALLADAVSFVVSFSSLACMRVRETLLPHSESQRPLWRHEVMQGVRLVATHAMLRPLALSSALFGFFDTMLVAIYVPYLVHELHIPAAVLGLIFGVAAGGGLLGASLAARLAKRAGLGRTMVGGMLVAALAELVVAIAQGPLLLAAVLVTMGEAGVQGGDVVFTVANRSARQLVIGHEAQGRTTATIRVLAAACAALGAVLGGWMADRLGLRPTVVIAGIGTILAAIFLWSSPIRHQRELTLVQPQGKVPASRK